MNTAKIVVPISGASGAELLKQLEQAKLFKPDMIEWRADRWAGNPAELPAMTLRLRQNLGIPLLFTYRSKTSGLQETIQSVIAAGGIDLVDIEFSDGWSMGPLIQMARKKNIQVIISDHDFERTPSEEELISLMLAMQAMEANIVKVAVTPQTPQDVLTLLSATYKFSQMPTTCPVIGISMGEMGQISRIAGGMYGSYATFAHVGEATAPGQIHIEKLKKIMDAMNSSVSM